ncbi:MAG: hypothetical protein AAGN66_24540 [Acidobacteriota bacterium]
MTRQAEAEQLSAYIDGQLGPEEREKIERLLEQDDDVRLRYEGMRRVTTGLGHLERLAPPPSLGQAVARRVALEGEHRSLLDRIEGGLSHFERQPSTFLMFSLVFALSLIILFFAWGIDKRGASPPIVPLVLEQGDQVTVQGIVFEQVSGGLWVQEGIDPAAPAEPLDLDSEEGRRILAERPELHSIILFLRYAHLDIEGEVREIQVRVSDPATGQPSAPAPGETPPQGDAP